MSENLPTKKQRQTLDFITGFIHAEGYSPSFREIQTALDVKSVSTVASHVDNLIAKGYLRKSEFGPRSLEVTNPSSSHSDAIGAIEQSITKKIATLDACPDRDTLVESLRILGLTSAYQKYKAQ